VEPLETRCLLSAATPVLDTSAAFASNTGLDRAAAVVQSQGNAETGHGLDSALSTPIDMGVPSIGPNGRDLLGDILDIKPGASSRSPVEILPDVGKGVADLIQPAVTVSVGMPANPTISITVSTPAVSVATAKLQSGWVITITIRSQVQSSLVSTFSASSYRSPSLSVRSDSLASRSRSAFGSDDPASSSLRSSSDWSYRSEGTPTTQALMVGNEMIAQQSSNGARQAAAPVGDSALEQQALALLAMDNDNSLDSQQLVLATGEEFPLFETDSFNLLRAGTLSADARQDLTAAFATYFAADRQGANAEAAARPVARQQRANERESDLILTGKQGQPVRAALLQESDFFFLHESHDLLLNPQGKKGGNKADEARPNVPGSDGKVIPGAQPQDRQQDESGSSSESNDQPDVKQGGMVWAGLAAAAAAGWNSFRRRRKRQQNAA